MSRESRDDFAPGGTLRNGYDKQAWVKDGRYIKCGHLEPCDCYGTAHEGEKTAQ